MVDNIEHKPRLRVITGDAQGLQPLFTLPQTLVARAPDDRSKFPKVTLAGGDLLKAARAGRRQPFVDFWSCLARKLPPVVAISAIAEDQLCGLSDANACFQGIKRGCGDDADGSRMIVYTLKPRHHFIPSRLPVVEYQPQLVDRDLVFLAFVRPNVGTQPGTLGVVTHWQFVQADKDDARLPMDWKTRFERRLW
jgi:hypothetical protein